MYGGGWFWFWYREEPKVRLFTALLLGRAKARVRMGGEEPGFLEWGRF
jgi:hypothetical protein